MSPARHIPNAITILRLALIIPTCMSLYDGRVEIALILFAIAGFSDGLDGFLARRFDWVSAFGKLVDPLADKALMLVTTTTLTVMGELPPMLLFLIIAKDLAVVGGVFGYTSLAGFPEIAPMRTGKVTTFLQILLVMIVMLTLIPVTFVNPAWLPALFWLVGIVTFIDGTLYLWIWTNKLTEDQRWLSQA